MNIERLKHWQFLEDELKAETEEFKNKYMASAIYLLKNDKEMYVAKFVAFKGGEMIMKFSNARALPRKGDYLMCMVLPPELQDYRKWGNKTYRDLYKSRYNSSECVCVGCSPSDDKNYSWVVFSKVSIDFANYIKNTPGIVLTFAPQRPPIDYLMNLQRVVEDNFSQGVSAVLDADYRENKWEPILIKQNNVTEFIYSQLSLSDTMILEGPPGTGKTYMIAELCQKLCSEGKSVLVTAMTNRALMEIAEKPALKSLLENHKIHKTNVSIDEARELKDLEIMKSITPMPGCLVLATYFIASGYAADLSIEHTFDYVIMDESSQAILAMFAASRKIGKKNLWVGDIHQLPPIVSLNGTRIKICEYNSMINGLKLLADNSSNPIYQLTKTYRFGQRAANYTGIFYNNSLVANESKQKLDLPFLANILKKEGGPSLILTDMPIGDSTPQFAILLIAYLIDCILENAKEKEIAVLTCMKKTARSLQKLIIQKIGYHKNVIVDTVARVQGLTTDITIFLVPDYSYIRTVEPRLFNVATSRARENTIIIADKYILDYPTINDNVRTYLERLKNDCSIYVPSEINERKKLGLTLRLE